MCKVIYLKVNHFQGFGCPSALSPMHRTLAFEGEEYGLGWQGQILTVEEYCHWWTPVSGQFAMYNVGLGYTDLY